jgi:hypothetical protein
MFTLNEYVFCVLLQEVSCLSQLGRFILISCCLGLHSSVVSKRRDHS